MAVLLPVRWGTGHGAPFPAQVTEGESFCFRWEVIEDLIGEKGIYGFAPIGDIKSENGSIVEKGERVERQEMVQMLVEVNIELYKKSYTFISVNKKKQIKHRRHLFYFPFWRTERKWIKTIKLH